MEDSNIVPEITDPQIEIEAIDPSLSIIDSIFDPAAINISSKLLTLDLIIERINQDNAEIELDTEKYFQRKGDLWDIGKQSRFIESILIRFPLPSFYFDGTDNNKWLIVDGLQRLCTIRNFVSGKLSLTELEFLTQLTGYQYKDLDRNLQRLLRETQIYVYIINPGTPENVKFNIFKRINTGGLLLEAQEIRHALYQGIPATFVAELAAEPIFKACTDYINPDRMLDRDFVTRFLAFYFFGYENFKNSLDNYMNEAMSQLNKISIGERDLIKLNFTKSMNANYLIFGRYAFRKISRDSDRRRPLNKALFDIFSVILANMDDNKRDILIKNKSQIINILLELLESDDAFWNSISSSTSDKRRIFYRFTIVEAKLQDIIIND